MARIYLVRHAKPTTTYGADPDPGLDSVGVTQARVTARHLADTVPRLPVYTSPLRRCRETAAALTEIWNCEATVHPPVAEIPSRPLDPAGKREWLMATLHSTWSKLPDLGQWRDSVVDSLLALPLDCVVHTHFIAINVAVGAAQNRDEVMCFRPDHASVTVIETDARQIRLVELGREAETVVLTRQ